jgi:probable addiction module antidote protein/putative addiction module killer protein
MESLNTLLRSSDFDAWLSGLTDQKAKARILGRIRSATFGNFGDCEPIGEGVSEMRIHVGAGYRVYYTRTGSTVYILFGWRRKGFPNERHCQSENNGSRAQKGETMKKKKITYKPFDAAEYLDNNAVIAEYLSAAAEDPNPDVFVAALGDVAKARGMAQIAKDAGLGRESLYKTLSAGAHPRFETINSVLHALGVKFAVVAEHES